MAFCEHMYVISHVTYEDFPPYIEKWYTPKIPHNIILIKKYFANILFFYYELAAVKMSAQELLFILIQSASVAKFLNFIPVFLIKPLVFILSSITSGAFPFTITRHEVVPSYKTHYNYKKLHIGLNSI